jgi:lipoate-protein ligase A
MNFRLVFGNSMLNVECSMLNVLHVLPASTALAAENMATDWLLLEAFPEPEAARLRFYGWTKPSFTFGYGQKWAEARAACPPGVDLIRRPTGGGLVDHRADWTYALVLPAAHPLAKVKACESYRLIHVALAEALNQNGTRCKLQGAECDSGASPILPQPVGASLATAPSSPTNLSICFEKAEQFDVIRSDNGQKIAGAAQKRNRQGLLFQGSVEPRVANEVRSWEHLAENFSSQLGEVLDSMPWLYRDPPWSEVALSQATARFASKEWNERR